MYYYKISVIFTDTIQHLTLTTPYHHETGLHTSMAMAIAMAIAIAIAMAMATTNTDIAALCLHFVSTSVVE